MHVRNLELLDKDRFVSLQGDLMQVISASAQIESILTDGFVELQQYIQILLLVLCWNLAAELFFSQLSLGLCEFLLRLDFFVLLR